MCIKKWSVSPEVCGGVLRLKTEMSLQVWRWMNAHSFAFCSFIRNTLIIIQWTVPWATWCSPWNMMLLGTKSISVSCSGMTFSFPLFWSPSILDCFSRPSNHSLFSWPHVLPNVFIVWMRGANEGLSIWHSFTTWTLAFTVDIKKNTLISIPWQQLLGPTIKPLFSQIKQAKCTRHPHFRIRHQMDNIGQCVWVEGWQQDVLVIKSMWHI